MASATISSIPAPPGTLSTSPSPSPAPHPSPIAFLPTRSPRTRLSAPGLVLQARKSVVRRKLPALTVRAASSEEVTSDVSKQLQEIFEDLKAKYDALENKSTVWIYGGGAVVALWLSSTIVGAINSVPLLPKIMELVGLGYTGWFVYRYLLFKSSRKQLEADLEKLKLKISGTTKEDQDTATTTTEY